MEFSYEEVREATNDFSPDLLVGKGSHGRVYKAIMAGGKSVVAVKKPSAFAPSNIQNEIAILSTYRSHRIVNLVGVAADPGGGRVLLLEYMPNGSLEDLIMRSGPDPPDWTRRASAAIQVGRALAGLHRAGIIHRDVKTANILLDGRWRPRLADFSLAVREGWPGRPAAGSMRYIDPGYIGPGQLGPAVDVFSFGVVLMELTNRRRRAAEVREGGLVGRMVEVAERCLEVEGRRPGMEEVVEGLERAVETVWWPPVTRWVREWSGRRLGRRKGAKKSLMDGGDDGGDDVVDGGDQL